MNLTGAMHVVRACLADLLASDAGRIVNVASTEGLVGGAAHLALHRGEARTHRVHALHWRSTTAGRD